MIVVTGTQRSGTTLLTRILIRNGYYAGSENFYDEQANGGYESPHIAWFLRNELMEDTSFPFIEFDNHFSHTKGVDIRLIHMHFGVQKSSYLMMHPVLLKKFLEYRGNQDTFIILKRNSKSVEKSKQKHSEQFSKDHHSLQQSADQIRDHFNSSLKLLIDYNVNFTILFFPYLVTDQNHIPHKLRKLNINLDVDYTDLIDQNKVSFL